ncbi:MAG: alpha/beta fold hydrolase [Lachnospiraceae bacterium]|nr:alpha/beta fold hydrolase [Lachnospiraceae bacterium]
MKKLTKVLIIILASLVVLAVGGSLFLGNYVADQILHQNADKETHDNSLKQLEVWGYDTDAFLAEYEGTDITATAEDGNEVPANYYNYGNDKCVIIVHGAGGDRYCVAPVAEKYFANGYDVIAIDQRGSGVNPDDRVTFGINEQLDVKAMVVKARCELGYDTVIVHGQSMGGQTTALYAANVTPGIVEAADAVILECPVPGMELILKEMFGDGDTDSFTAKYFVGTSKFMMGIRYGIDYDDGDTIALASNIEIPALVIVSDQDSVCLPDQVEQIYANIACEEKEIVHFDSAHIEGCIDYPAEYEESVMSFLENVLN